MFNFLLEKTMSEQIYFYIGLFGATISAVMTLLMLIGLLEEVGIDFDADCDCDVFESGFTPFKFFTFRGLVAGITFFGWAGYVSNNIYLAAFTGIITYLLIGLVYTSSRRLQQQGNYSLSDAVGKNGTVYMKIKGDMDSVGKVHVFVAGGLKELNAISEKDLECGDKIIVTDTQERKLIVKKVEG